MRNDRFPRAVKRLSRLVLTVAAIVALSISRSVPASAVTTDAAGCGSVVLEGSLSVPRGRAVRQVVRLTANCVPVVEAQGVLTPEEAAFWIHAAESTTTNRAPLPLASAAKGPGLRAASALVAGGPLHMKLRLLDAVNLDVTSINPHDLSYGYNGSTITSSSHSAYQTWATDNTGTCGTGYYGWHPANGSLTISGGGVGYTFIDSLAHAEFWYQGVFQACNPYYYYNILDTKLTGFGNGSASSCAYRLSLAHTVFGWHTDLLCWDAYGSTTPPPF